MGRYEEVWSRNPDKIIIESRIPLKPRITLRANLEFRLNKMANLGSPKKKILPPLSIKILGKTTKKKRKMKMWIIWSYTYIQCIFLIVVCFSTLFRVVSLYISTGVFSRGSRQNKKRGSRKKLAILVELSEFFMSFFTDYPLDSPMIFFNVLNKSQN